MKITPQDLERNYPVVAFFFEHHWHRYLEGVYEFFVIASNGITALCCDSDGGAHLISLSHVARVVARDTEYVLSSIDAGLLNFRPRSGNTTLSAGPVSGAVDSSVNVRAYANQLGIDYEATIRKDSIVEPNAYSVRGLTTQQMEEGPRSPSAEELLRIDGADDVLMINELSLPDLDVVVVDDAEPIRLDTPHTGRVIVED